MKTLSMALLTILIIAQIAYKTIKKTSSFTNVVKKTTPWLSANWKNVLLILIMSVASFRVGWLTKSPEVVTKVEIEKIPQYIDRPKVVEVVRPNNCIAPAPVSSDEIQDTDDAILFLIREYKVKYLACLDSLAPKP